MGSDSDDLDPHEALYAAYLEELRAKWPRFKIIEKGDSPFCKVIDKVLRVLTFGGQRTFMTSYVTTLGYRIYVPDGYDRHVAPGRRYLTMRHEAVHVRQFRTLTWPLITLVYVLLPIPMGFAGGRAFLEWQAYRETLTATWQLYGEEAARDPDLHERIVRRYTGPDYGWMWLRGKTIRAAIERHLDRLGAAPPPPLKF